VKTDRHCQPQKDNTGSMKFSYVQTVQHICTGHQLKGHEMCEISDFWGFYAVIAEIDI